MALKLIRHVGTITATTLGDDLAHGLALGKLGNGNAFRVNEFGGNDIFIKITSIDQRTAVTSSNGMYVKGGTTVTVVPEGETLKPSLPFTSTEKLLLLGNLIFVFVLSIWEILSLSRMPFVNVPVAPDTLPLKVAAPPDAMLSLAVSVVAS